MKCSKCVAAGERSTVRPGVSYTTTMYCAPYYDEDGRYHHHDGNITVTDYRCSRGHHWREESGRSPCPTCGDAW